MGEKEHVHSRTVVRAGFGGPKCSSAPRRSVMGQLEAHAATVLAFCVWSTPLSVWPRRGIGTNE